MRKIDAALGRIRLLLSDVSQRESLTQNLRDQYTAQRRRVLQASLYGDLDVNTIVGLLEEIERKLAEVERGARVLALLRQRAETELRSLTLTRQAEDAKSELALLDLRGREIAAELAATAGDYPVDVSHSAELRAEQARLAEECARLRSLIAEASDLAAQSLGPLADFSAREGRP